ncbi:MAG: IS630 family transposase [Pseudonocardiaceae bacterium]
MPNRVRILQILDSDRVVLERRVQDRGAAARDVQRARIVLLSTQGLTGPEIAERVGCTEPTVVLWRRRFTEEGLVGLDDRARTPPPATTVTDEVRDEILSATLSKPPAGLGITHWSSRLLADWLRRSGTAVSHDSISRLWRRFGIQPWRCETFKFSTDPELEAKVRDVVGLYLNPPDNAIVLSIDEKSQIQARRRTWARTGRGGDGSTAFEGVDGRAKCLACDDWCQESNPHDQVGRSGGDQGFGKH